MPQQLVVHSAHARNKVTDWLYGASLLELRASLPAKRDRVDWEGLYGFSLPSALIACSPNCFRKSPIDARGSVFNDPKCCRYFTYAVSRGHSVIAGRLAGAFRNMGRERITDDILKAMRAAGYNSYEQDF